MRETYLYLISDDGDLKQLIAKLSGDDYKIILLESNEEALNKIIEPGIVILDCRNNNISKIYMDRSGKYRDLEKFYPVICILKKPASRILFMEIIIRKNFYIYEPIEEQWETLLTRTKPVLTIKTQYRELVEGKTFEGYVMSKIIERVTKLKLTGYLRITYENNIAFIEFSKGKIQNVEIDDKSGIDLIEIIENWNKGRYIFIKNKKDKDVLATMKQSQSEQISTTQEKTLSSIITTKDIKEIIKLNEDGKILETYPEDKKDSFLLENISMITMLNAFSKSITSLFDVNKPSEACIEINDTQKLFTINKNNQIIGVLCSNNTLRKNILPVIEKYAIK